MYSVSRKREVDMEPNASSTAHNGWNSATMSPVSGEAPGRGPPPQAANTPVAPSVERSIRYVHTTGPALSTPGDRADQATHCTVWHSASGLSANAASTLCERVLVRLLVIATDAMESEGFVDPVPANPVHQDHDGSRVPSSAAFCRQVVQ